jgi:hypothetical protein
VSEHHSSRRAQGLKKGAVRQQKRRDGLKKAGVPTTHVLNRALAEGMFYHLDAERSKGVPVNEAVISVQDVFVYAGKVLSRRTNGTDQYEVRAVVHAIRARVGKLSGKKFRIPPTWTTPSGDEED